MSQATRSDRVLQYAALLILFALGACASAPAQRSTTDTVKPGIEVLLGGDMAALKGMRVGLITNHTGLLRDGRTTIDALYADPRIKLVALYGPEHGLRGAALAGVTVSNDKDEKTGLPIYSLYGATNKPTPEMLANVDALVFDIQDIGARYYTYPWTMALAMKAAAENHKRFVVLDRPNPIGGVQVQGNVNDTLTFVGLYPVPMRHGLTVGELATMINRKFNVGADLVVIKAEGWKRNQYYDQTGMPWVKPSPNMPTVLAATNYPGTCLFEGTDVSVGRGTDNAYEQIGAPYIDSNALIERLNGYHFPGVRYEAVQFTPVKPGDGKYDGQLSHGVRYVVTDRGAYDPVASAMATMIELKKLYPAQFKINKGIDRLIGSSKYREMIAAGASLGEVMKGWTQQASDFDKERQQYLLYR